MSSNIAVELTNVSKKYTLHHEKPTLVENIVGGKRKEEFWALRDIDLKIRKGERVGIVGPNGSGKTTLLEIIAGITYPTKGKVGVEGRVVSVIDLGAGFQPDLTGEENVWLSGMLVGMTKGEVESKYKKIVAFAGIGRFIDAPLYTYSEGMKLRLGFSVAVNSNPDVVLLDENFAVGDKEFQQKSFEKLSEMIKQKKTLVFASHLLDFVARSCDWVVWLERGKIKRQGGCKSIVAEYRGREVSG